MKKNVYCGVACGLLAAALVYPCEPICWAASILCLFLSAYWLSRAEEFGKLENEKIRK